MILAMDVASSTGTCVGPVGTTPRIQTFDLNPPGPDPEGQARLQAVYDLTIRLIRQHNVQRIAVEEPIVNLTARTNGKRTENKRTPFLLIGLVGCVKAAAYTFNVPVRLHTPIAARRHFIGPKNANKPRDVAKAMVQHRCDQLGWRWDTDDGADAAAVWDLECNQRDPGAIRARASSRSASWTK